MDSAASWSAPAADGPVDATVALPGSKSMTNRALILAALATDPTVIKSPLRSRDTLLMAEALRTLGIPVSESGDDWRVLPGDLNGPARIDVGLAGTVMRFLPPVAALADGEISFDGDPRARERPMRPLLTALRALGVKIDDGGRGGLPFTVRARGAVTGGMVTIDASGSSQLLSGLLLAAPRFDKGIEVRHEGSKVPSAPHIAMTVGMLRAAGAMVEAGENTWRVAPGRIKGGESPIEPDLSNAAPFVAAALVTGGRVTLRDWPAETTQPGDGLRELVPALGGTVSYDHNGFTVQGGGVIHGIDVDLGDVNELTCVIAALAAIADGPSRLTGIAHMRGHETDRLAALATELSALGADATETPDGLAIRPRPLHGRPDRPWGAYADHRMATAGALLGLVIPGVTVDDIGCTDKTIPDFPGRWAALVSDNSRSGDTGS